MEGHCQLEERVDRDTMNEWIINTLIDIQSNTKMTNKTERNEQKLFRMLGLCYRSKYPMKGELFTIDRDIKAYFEDQLCQ